jgi:hypothetical protein
MKKVFVVLFTLTFIFGMLACQLNTTTTTTTQTTTTITTTASTTQSTTQSTTTQITSDDVTTQSTTQTTTSSATTTQSTTESTLSDTEILQGIMNDFNLSGDLTSVTDDITLPIMAGDASISWETSHLDLIDTIGNVNQPLDADTVVTLTATFTYNSVQLTK